MSKNNNRYSRHYLLQNFGEAAQQKLADTRVLVVGAGGLGCPVLQYLAAAGVGVIGIVDDDTVSLSNLQRQVLYTVNDIGLPKTRQAAAKLNALNNEITINEHCLKLAGSNALSIIEQYDIVVDCTDNFAARYMINDACCLLHKPLVFGAVYQYEGQVAVFNVADATGIAANYRNLFAAPPGADDAPDCNEAGVLGILPGIIGTMQATEVIKLIAGIGEPLINKLLSYNALTMETYIMHIAVDDSVNDLLPKDAGAFTNTDYAWLCGIQDPGVETIDAAVFKNMQADENILFVDVREPGELPVAAFEHIQIPLSQLLHEAEGLEKETLVLFCQSGRRSMQAAKMLKGKLSSNKKIFTLAGGIAGLGT